MDSRPVPPPHDSVAARNLDDVWTKVRENPMAVGLTVAMVIATTLPAIATVVGWPAWVGLAFNLAGVVVAATTSGYAIAHAAPSVTAAA
jgi:hypothetical protein